jgi:hypothetical protein
MDTAADADDIGGTNNSAAVLLVKKLVEHINADRGLVHFIAIVVDVIQVLPRNWLLVAVVVAVVVVVCLDERCREVASENREDGKTTEIANFFVFMRGCPWIPYVGRPFVSSAARRDFWDDF